MAGTDYNIRVKIDGAMGVTKRYGYALAWWAPVN
jgi:hypothetical protein